MFTLYVWRIKEYCHCFESYINGIKLNMAFFFFNMAFCNLSSFYLMLCGCFFFEIYWRRKWPPTLSHSSLGKPMDRGGWQATMHVVAKELDMT